MCIISILHITHLSLLTGVIIANTRSGIVDRMRSHLQPKFGIIANAIATSKQAPSAQKHCKQVNISCRLRQVRILLRFIFNHAYVQ